MSAYRDNSRPTLSTDEDYARAILRPVLVPGETILWANRPRRGIRYERNSYTTFNLLWTLFALVWVLCGLVTDVSLGMGLLGVPFVLIGLHGIFGRSLVDWRLRGKRVYGLTNRRLLIATPSRVVASPWLGELRAHLIKDRDGYGDIRVVAPRLELRAVPNAEEVHRLLLEVQATAPESAPAPSSAVPESAAPSSAVPESEGTRAHLG